MKLNLNNLKRNPPKQQDLPVKEINTDSQPSFKLTFTNNKVYDLDDMIKKKRRGNPDTELILKVNLPEEILDNIINLTTCKILDDYKVEYSTEESSPIYFKKQVSRVLSFEALFDRYFKRNYEKYLIANGSAKMEGAIALNTLMDKVSIDTRTIKKYSMEDVAENEKKFINIYDTNKPLLIWTDGTPDNGCDVSSTPQLDTLCKILTTKPGSHIILTREEESLDISVNGLLTLADKKELEKEMEVLSESISSSTSEQLELFKQSMNNEINIKIKENDDLDKKLLNDKISEEQTRVNTVIGNNNARMDLRMSGIENKQTSMENDFDNKIINLRKELTDLINSEISESLTKEY